MPPRLGSGRLCLRGSVFTWVALALVRFLQILSGHAQRVVCDLCGGPGLFRGGPCPNCGGVGRWWTLESDGLDALGDLRVELFYLAGLMAILGLIVYAFTVVECRTCRTRGCGRCDGRGWFTVLDRWVTKG